MAKNDHIVKTFKIRQKRLSKNDQMTENDWPNGKVVREVSRISTINGHFLTKALCYSTLNGRLSTKRVIFDLDNLFFGPEIVDFRSKIAIFVY